MITLGDCSDCTPCGGGGGHCDLFAFVTSGTRAAIDGSSLFPADEGDDITLTVARLPDCFRYNGTPAEFEVEAGYPPPVADGDYYYDTTSTGVFWLNTAGVYSIEPAPSWYGVGEIDIGYALTFTECGCPHMLTAATGTLTWPNGDTANQNIVAPVTCPGPPTFWACSGDLAGGESGTVTLTVDSESGGCATVGYAANIVGLCTHDPPFPDWGLVPYYARWWAGHDFPSTGWQGAQGTGRYLSYEQTMVAVEGTTHLTGTTFQNGNQIQSFTSSNGVPSPGSGGDYFYDLALTYPDGVISDSEFFKDFGGGESIEFTLSDLSGTYAFPVTSFDPETQMSASRALYPDGTSQSYGWDQAGRSYTYTIKGNQFHFSEDFDPDTYYTASGPEWFNIPFEDWTVTSDPGSVYVQTSATGQSYGLVYGFSLGAAGRQLVLEAYASGIICWESDIDATNARIGNPVPQLVEVRLLYYEDAALISTGAWVDITDTVYPVPAPATLGGADVFCYYVAEIRSTYLNASCVPVVSPVFVCHPGIAACP